MAGILTIAPGSPDWWLSPDIWVTPLGRPTSPPGTANPIAGEAYNVSVRVHDNYPDPVPGGSWDLFVCWAIPTTGPIPVPTAAGQHAQQRSGRCQRPRNERRYCANGHDLDAIF